MLNYFGLNKAERSNSYLENYNRRIKLKLSEYLYGKNKCRISWPLFLYFILHEEDEYRKEIYENESNIEDKYEKNIIINKTKKIEYNNNNIKDIKNRAEENEINTDNKIDFLHWNENSCRYDTLFNIYIYFF